MNRQVVLIEDSTTYREYLTRCILRSYENIEVHGFENAESALGQLKSIKPDCIVLDHHLEGGINGAEVLPLLKEIIPSCHILMVSGTEDHNVMTRALEGEADAFITKNALTAHYLGDFLENLMTPTKKRKKFWGLLG